MDKTCIACNVSICRYEESAVDTNEGTYCASCAGGLIDKLKEAQRWRNYLNEKPKFPDEAHKAIYSHQTDGLYWNMTGPVCKDDFTDQGEDLTNP